MQNFIDCVCGVCGLGGLTLVSTSTVTEWVGLICTVIITLTTCGIQAYRMIRDRDTDKKKEKEENKNEE